ncbi:hypothetical protein Zmor_005609 [Zophobas morio]|uniref:Zinc finger PHD-type domain-containing protein n=1 Tax=Zophobas morio TaxID=2755281 RepID=A0AA38IT69_9CUCU|nr:hypothetical protein Zmor_005609 [Zophobas morio]
MCEPAGRMTDSGLALLNSGEKPCKKCKQKVSTAFIKCIKCDDVYHKSCLQQLISRGKNFVILLENAMMCDEHKSELNHYDRMCLQIVNILKNENLTMKNEIEALKVEIEELRKTSASNLQSVHDLNGSVKTDLHNFKGEMVSCLSKFTKEINDNINRKFKEFVPGKTENVHVEKSQPTDKQKPMLTYSEMTKKLKTLL